MASDFSASELKDVRQRLENSLQKVFNNEGYQVFDFKMEPKPSKPKEQQPEFWGGYKVGFKIISTDLYSAYKGNLEKLRRESSVIGLRQKRAFHIDISKHEYIEKKAKRIVEGYVGFVYTPEMLLIEKLRAICQQMEEYTKIIPNTTRTGRARDFFDIYVLLENFNIHFEDEEFKEMVRKIFGAKRVPLKLIELIPNYRGFHKPDFEAVKDTINPDYDLREYDFYFDYVVNICDKLKSLWKK